jgi:sec-independent protein translocase protein TatA
MFSNLRGSEWLILILVIVLLFGARRLPDAARGLGRSLRIFKAETKGLSESTAEAQDAQPSTPAQEAAPPAQGKAVDSAAPAPLPPSTTVGDTAAGEQARTQP